MMNEFILFKSVINSLNVGLSQALKTRGSTKCILTKSKVPTCTEVPSAQILHHFFQL